MPANRILIVGNSITYHAPAPDIGWTASCGMAASAPEKDYAHQFLNAVSKLMGSKPESCIVNISEFEVNFDAFDIAVSLKREIAFKADTVVVAIGENVAPLNDAGKQSRFKSRLIELLAAVKGGDPGTQLFVRSCFWADKVKDDILRQACEIAGGVFVDISKICADESNFARAERGFTNPDVAAHPGDKGMRAITNALLSSWKK